MQYKQLSNCGEVFEISNVFPHSYFNALIEEFDFKHNIINFDKREHPDQPLFGQHIDNSRGCNDHLGWNYKFIHAFRYVEYAAKKILKKDLELKRINTNYQFYGMESAWHNDYNGPGTWWSMVTFINFEWDYTWDGQLVICTKDRKYLNVNPTPNTGVLFPSGLDHRGSAPNRWCNTCRMSLAFLFKAV